jgi:hypothetical protein
MHLSPAEKRRVEELLFALRTETETWVNPSSWLLDAAFADEFQSRLLVQHVFMGSPLFQEGFDAAFAASARAAGRKVDPAPEGQRFWDITVNGAHISLKSSKAKSLRNDTLHISKLTEAAWIQDCRSARLRHDRTCELFEEYTTEVQSVFQLRHFQKASFYELVEIPITLFQQVLLLPASEFNADGPTINIPIGQVPPDFTLKLDRSDAKVTIANIQKSLCTTHGTWKIKCPQKGE